MTLNSNQPTSGFHEPDVFRVTQNQHAVEQEAQLSPTDPLLNKQISCFLVTFLSKNYQHRSTYFRVV